MRTIHRDIATAVIFSRDGRILQGMKDSKAGGVYPGCWHIPGGGIQDGEDQLAALQREILEETNIDIRPYRATLIDDQGVGESEKILHETGERVVCRMRFYVYRVVIHDKDAGEIPIQLNDDLVSYQWTRPEDLDALPLTPPSRELFKRLGFIRT